MVGKMAASSHAEESALLATFGGGHMPNPELISTVWEELGTGQHVMYLGNEPMAMVMGSIRAWQSVSFIHGI